MSRAEMLVHRPYADGCHHAGSDTVGSDTTFRWSMRSAISEKSRVTLTTRARNNDVIRPSRLEERDDVLRGFAAQVAFRFDGKKRGMRRQNHAGMAKETRSGGQRLDRQHVQ